VIPGVVAGVGDRHRHSGADKSEPLDADDGTFLDRRWETQFPDKVFKTLVNPRGLPRLHRGFLSHER